MKLIQGLLFRVLIAALFCCVAERIAAQSATTAQQYAQSVNQLSDELKSKLEKIQYSNNENIYVRRFTAEESAQKGAIYKAATHALEDLKNVKKFYLKPNFLNLNEDKKHYLVNIINNNGKGLYIYGYQKYLSPKKYYETSVMHFRDPSGREIKCRSKLLTFDQLSNLIKTSQLEVLYGRESRSFLDVTGSSTNGGIGAVYDNVPYGWLLKSSYTNEVVQLPFGTFWTRTVDNNDGYKCITVDVMVAHDYEETVLNKSEKALSLYAVEIDYSQLLQWYKESLDYIMLDVNELIREQENKISAQEHAFREADRKESLGMLMVETASKLKADKALFDYIITDNTSTYDINVLANANTVRFAKEFWSKLKLLNDANGNISLYYFGQQGGGHYNYNVATSNDENKSHLKNLLIQISDSPKSNISLFMKTLFRGGGSIEYNIKNGREFRIHGVNGNSRYGDKGIDIPCLDLYMTKGDIIYSFSVSKKSVSLLNNIKNTGYNIKIKK